MRKNYMPLLGYVVISTLIAFNLPAATPANTTVPVNIKVQSTIPLKIGQVNATPSASGLSGIQYAITNSSTSRLLAVEVTWELYFGPGGPERTVQRADYFLSPGGKIAPGASGNLSLGAIVDKRRDGTTTPLKSATATITYAQFANGDQFGSDIRSVSQSLKNYRDAEMAEYRQVLQDYKTGGATGLNAALAWEKMPATHGGRTTWLSLNQLKKQRGISAVVNELTRVSKLSVPGSAND